MPTGTSPPSSATSTHGTRPRGGTGQGVATARTCDGTCTGPLTDTCGHEQIAALITKARRRFAGRPAASERRSTGGHHDTARGWELVDEATAAPDAGFGVITLAAEGKIHGVHGILGRAPPPTA